MQKHDAVLETAEHDVTAVLGDRGTYPGLQRFFDLRDDLALVHVGLGLARGARREQRLAGGEMLHDHGEDGRLEQLPIAVIVLGDGHEIAAEEHPAHPFDAEQGVRQRRSAGRFRGGKIGGARCHDVATGKKLQSRWVGRLFGLNKHAKWRSK